MSNTPTPEAHVAAYRGVRARVAEAVAGADRAARCPLTPEWTVGDTLAHLVGVATDVAAGNLEGVATDPWTAAQVAARTGRSIGELLAEWEESGPQFDELMFQVPIAVSGQAIFDAVTHEHDIRHALGAPGAHDSDAIGLAAGWIAVAGTARKADVTPAIEIDYGSEAVQWGTGDVAAKVALTPFEFVRISSGRRSEAQIVAAGYPSVELALAAEIFSAASFDVVE
jgi:uncharacterized protein (TIGR03083 family)